MTGLSKDCYKHNLLVTYYRVGESEKQKEENGGAKKGDFHHGYWVSDDTQFVKYTVGMHNYSKEFFRAGNKSLRSILLK